MSMRENTHAKISCSHFLKERKRTKIVFLSKPEIPQKSNFSKGASNYNSLFLVS